MHDNDNKPQATIDFATLMAEASAKAKSVKAESKSTSRKWAAGAEVTPPNPLNVHQFAWRPTHQVLILQTTVCQCCGWSIRVSRGLLIREVHPRTHAVRMHQRPTLDYQKLPKATRDLPVAKVYGCDYCFYKGEAFIPHEEEPLPPQDLLGKTEDEIRLDRALGALGLGGIDQPPAKAGPSKVEAPTVERGPSDVIPPEHEE